MRRLSLLIQLILLIVVVALGLLIALKNPGDLTLWLGRDITLPTVAVLFALLAVGCLLGLLLASAQMLRLRTQNRRLTKQLDSAAAEVTNLRSLPINSL